MENKVTRCYIPKPSRYSDNFAIRLERSLVLGNIGMEFYHEGNAKSLLTASLNKNDNSIQIEFFMNNLFEWAEEQKKLRDNNKKG